MKHLFKLKIIFIGFLIHTVCSGACSLTSSNLMFGQYGGTSVSPAINGDTKLYVSCDDSDTHTFCVTSTSTGTQKIEMSTTGSTLNYTLYKDPARINPLTNTDCLSLLAGTATESPITASCPQSNPCQLSVYGKIAAAQPAEPGTYMGNFNTQLNVTGQGTGSPILVAAQAYINTECNITTTPFSFGAYNSQSELKITQNAIHVNCSLSTPYSVKLGAGSSGNFSTRTMASYGNTLNYNLYLPDPAIPNGSCSSYNTIWDDNTNVLNGSGTSIKQDIAVCGKIPPGQIGGSGTYQDTVIVTVTY